MTLERGGLGFQRANRSSDNNLGEFLEGNPAGILKC